MIKAMAQYFSHYLYFYCILSLILIELFEYLMKCVKDYE